MENNKKEDGIKVLLFKTGLFAETTSLFLCGLIDTSEVSLQEMHFDLLREELGYDI